MKIFVYHRGYYGYFIRAADLAQAHFIVSVVESGGRKAYPCLKRWEEEDNDEEHSSPATEPLRELSPDGEPGIIGAFGDWP